MAAILQSPGEWMIPLDKDRNRKSESENEDQIEPRGDPEMAPLYLRRLLPVFCTTFQSTMLASVRKASLGLIKKMIHYIQPSLLEELCSSESTANNFGTQLVEVIATVLDNEVRKAYNTIFFGVGILLSPSELRNYSHMNNCISFALYFLQVSYCWPAPRSCVIVMNNPLAVLLRNTLHGRHIIHTPRPMVSFRLPLLTFSHFPCGFTLIYFNQMCLLATLPCTNITNKTCSLY